MPRPTCWFYLISYLNLSEIGESHLRLCTKANWCNASAFRSISGKRRSLTCEELENYSLVKLETRKHNSARVLLRPRTKLKWNPERTGEDINSYSPFLFGLRWRYAVNVDKVVFRKWSERESELPSVVFDVTIIGKKTCFVSSAAGCRWLDGAKWRQGLADSTKDIWHENEKCMVQSCLLVKNNWKFPLLVTMNYILRKMQKR